MISHETFLSRTLFLAIFGLLVGLLEIPRATGDELEKDFQSGIAPLLNRYCLDCHGKDSPEAKFDITLFESPSHVTSLWSSWQAVLSRVHEGEMPPADYEPQPTQDEREMLAEWTQRFRVFEAHRNAGDPGPTSTRRLNNAEFNHSVRDLTGVDIRPTENFPIDPANEAGFDNSAESLSISPALLTKYLDAARLVADYMLLTPEGISFAPHPVITDTDRDKFCVQRIVDFYRAQQTEIAPYLVGAWKLRYLAPKPDEWDKTLQKVAAEESLSLKYLQRIWDYLHSEIDFGPGADLQKEWLALPQDLDQASTIADSCKKMAAQAMEVRKSLRIPVENLQGPRGMSAGSQPLALWKNRQLASNRRSYDESKLAPDHPDSILSEADRKKLESEGEASNQASQERLLRDYRDFCSTFPDTFVVLERGRTYLADEVAAKEAKGRLLSAGFHSMMGYFRDDRPMCELLLNEEENRHLDRLWNDLFFISDVPNRQYSGFLWYERAEASFINDPAFNFVRAEDKSATTEGMIQRFRNTYVDKLKTRKADDRVISATEFHFEEMNRWLREFDQKHEVAKEIQLASLLQFAERAFRRPLTESDRELIRGFYTSVLQVSGSDHRTAMEDTLISILISPSFLYRWDLQSGTSSVESASNDSNVVPLTPYELASRLSYFAWCSQPDDRLMKLAESGKLTGSDVIAEELLRMIADPRSEGMQLEFLGNWLDFRRFESHNGVDREQFPSFDDALRTSMAREPLEFFRHLLQTDGKLSDLILSDRLIVDEKLAEHYGIAREAWNRPSSETWFRVEDAGRYQRGGLLTMGVFLTQNSPGLRTSPVKRGYWVVRKLLGERIPPPPPDVPELPPSERDLGDITLRDMLAIHREQVSCAACHKRFDAAGLLLEGFDPIGRPRTEDLGGRPISTDAELPNGEEAAGLSGLKRYILEERMEDFRRHFCESLAAFALSRTLIISDDLLVEDMLRSLEESGDRITAAMQCVVRSPQFLNKRSR